MRTLITPGMGDAYWALGCLYREMRTEGIRPEIYLYNAPGGPQAYVHGQHRSIEFMKMLPWADYGGVYDSVNTRDIEGVWDFNMNHRDFDMVVNMNTRLENGYPLKGMWWKFPIEFQEKPPPINGPYILLYLTDYGIAGKKYRRAWPHEEMAPILREIARDTGCRLVFTGVHWDKTNTSRYTSLLPEAVNLVNQTTTAALFNLIRGASGFIGLAAGNGIMAASYFNIPTVLFWSRSMWPFGGFWDNCIDPSFKKYLPMFTGDCVNREREVTKLTTFCTENMTC